MRNLILLGAFLINTLLSAQVILKGYIYDDISSETLIGANIIASNGTGTVSDLEGYFELVLPKGEVEIRVSYVGYKEEKKTLRLEKNLTVNFYLNTQILDEVQVVSDIARSRETPVAFSNISPKKLEEELAGQDIPMILNSTPGVYATQSGGGDGDARISIRGFNQRNVAVMIDGIPMNDMENGWVYWSNWFGLDLMTKTIQVQRGLGASKLAIPAVGGTMNILTKGINNKEGVSFSQNVGNNGFLRSTLGYNSGKLKNGWGYSLAGSYKRGNGWVDQTWTEGFFYFMKVQKKFNDHSLSFTAFGAPQSHGQRSYKKAISLYDMDYAASLGIDTTGVDGDYGLRYNEHWGELNRYTVNFDENGNPMDTTFAKNEVVNEKMNYYHKPQLSLNHLWSVNKKMVVSNVLYASLGNGGGTGVTPSLVSGSFNSSRQIDFQSMYDRNIGNTRESLLGFTYDPSIDPLYSSTEHKSTQFLRSSINNHRWFGLLSTYNYQANKEYNFSGGIDLRHYTGEHYREVYDLLGGDYYVANESVAARDSSAVIRKGDKFAYHNDGLVKWLGLFQQMEYNTGNWSAFVNVSFSSTGYKRIDYFRPMDLVLNDTIMVQALSYGDTILNNGNEYTVNSPEARHTESKWKWIPAYTIKYGFNYNINESNNVFFNSGYLEKAPRFNNIFDYDNRLFADIRNEKVAAIELGHSFSSNKISSNLNLYHTEWFNKPQSGSAVVDGEPIMYNINGINALHKGVEFDVSIKISEKISLEFLSSVGDWRWTSGDTIRSYDDNNQLIGLDYFDASGVHVGDAAQLQLGSSLRYQFNKNTYVKLKAMRFDNHYADFNPFDLQGEDVGRDSWKTPAYSLLDLHGGYRFRYAGMLLDFKINILNVLNTIYISDALNNDSYISGNQFNFDAASASVFFGMGRRLTSSLKISF
ncbi:MAG: TonB-dependent receptor [Flavobacteriaceae bacterium]|nr:TonB-dependent receptor [Flavobacteriaceae bacterium]